MQDLFDQDSSSYVVFGYPQKNATKECGRAYRSYDGQDLGGVLHHYLGAHTLFITHTHYCYSWRLSLPESKGHIPRFDYALICP